MQNDALLKEDISSTAYRRCYASFIHQRAPVNKVNNKRWPSQLPVQRQQLSAPKINMLLDCQYITIVHLQQKPSQEKWLQALCSLGISGSGFSAFVKHLETILIVKGAIQIKLN